MKLARYVCTHCGRKFEAEEKEILECPGCFWTSSVKKEDDAREEKAAAPSGPAQAKRSLAVHILPPVLGFFAVILLGAALWFLGPLVRDGLSKAKSARPQPSDKPVVHLTPGKGDAPALPSSAPSFAGQLTAEDSHILANRVQLSADRPLSEAEQAVLSKRVELKTGIVEKLPSQPWSLEGYKELIANQEKIYKVPLPRSYKKKLEELFKAKYLPAAEAFSREDLIQARNLWVESLGFPIYANDINKHRGVVLTMLRPFITDTLSKVAAVNSTLVERKVRDREAALAEDYGKLLAAAEKKSWDEASGLVLSINQTLDQLRNPERVAGGPAPYPDSLKQVDPGIQATLFELLNVPPPPVADTDPLAEDLWAKRRVIESFMPVHLEKAQAAYDEALDAIARKDWPEAERKLKTITLAPLAMNDDVRAKLEVLKKFINGSASDEAAGQPAE